MSPAELRAANIQRFQTLLARATDPAERARMEQLIVEEGAKPDTAYPPVRNQSSLSSTYGLPPGTKGRQENN